MRTIKFRAWDRIEKKMIYDALEIKNIGLGDGSVVADEEVQKGNELDWMQFTGLLSKEGKEIYEGDILLVFDEDIVPVTDDGQGPIEECNHLVPVEMRDGVWGFEIPKSHYHYGETGWFGLHYWKEEINGTGYEIVGNIYENPELLT